MSGRGGNLLLAMGPPVDARSHPPGSALHDGATIRWKVEEQQCVPLVRGEDVKVGTSWSYCDTAVMCVLTLLTPVAL